MKDKIKKQLRYLKQEKIIITNRNFLPFLPAAVLDKEKFEGFYDLDSKTLSYWYSDVCYHNGDYYNQGKGKVVLNEKQEELVLKYLYTLYLKECEQKAEKELKINARNKILADKGII